MSGFVALFKDPIEMVKALRQTGNKPLSLWGQAINFPQMIGGLIFITKPLGLAVFVSWALGMVFVGRIYRLRGLSPWLSLCHVTWLPLYPFLLMALVKPENSVYYYWLFYVTVTITISLVLDFKTVYQALKGQTPEIYQNTNPKINTTKEPQL